MRASADARTSDDPHVRLSGMRVAPTSGVHSLRSQAESGFSLVELIIVVGMMGVLGAVAIPTRVTGAFGLHTAQSTLVADMRMARGTAISRTVHYRVEIFNANSYGVLKMMEVSGSWVQDGTPVLNRDLPANVSFTTGVGSSYEFNTRGLLIDPTSPFTITLTDADTGHSRMVDVWPSGQVVPGDTL